MNDTDRRIAKLAQRARRAAPTPGGVDASWLATRVVIGLRGRTEEEPPLWAISAWSLSISCALVLLCAAASWTSDEADEQSVASFIVQTQLPE